MLREKVSNFIIHFVETAHWSPGENNFTTLFAGQREALRIRPEIRISAGPRLWPFRNVPFPEGLMVSR